MMNENAMRAELEKMGAAARRAAYVLAGMSAKDKNAMLENMAAAVEAATPAILSANAMDMAAGRAAGLSAAMLDRLALDDKRVRAMAAGLRAVAAQTDPVGVELARFRRPNGLDIQKITVPIGVIGILYEARPNVTVDAAGICLKAGNAVILRGGKEAFHSNTALAAALAAGTPDGVSGAVQLVPWLDRAAVGLLLKMNQYLDLVIPRGGESLIRTVVAAATMPVIKHYKGVCHLYIDAGYDLETTLAIIINAKCQRPGVCNALESILIARDAAPQLVPPLAERLAAAGVTVHGDAEFCALDPRATLAEETDYSREYLALELSAKIVSGVDEAIERINFYGSHHSDGILSNQPAAVEKFLNNVDSAVVYHNASTRFTDGGEFGMGAEIGISTDKLHARGPMGVNELVSYKYVVRGHGQIR